MWLQAAWLLSGGIGAVLFHKLEVNNENDGGENQESDTDPQKRHQDLPSVHACNRVFDAGIQTVRFNHLDGDQHGSHSRTCGRVDDGGHGNVT